MERKCGPARRLEHRPARDAPLAHGLDVEVGAAERAHQPEPQWQVGLGAARSGDVADVDDVLPAELMFSPSESVLPAKSDGGMPFEKSSGFETSIRILKPV